MTDSNNLIIALMSALALMVSGLALWQSIRKSRVDPEEPITMSGGSLHMLSQPWDVDENTATASRTTAHSCAGIEFCLDSNDDSRTKYKTPTGNEAFTITFEYSKNPTPSAAKWTHQVFSLTYTPNTDPGAVGGTFSATLEAKPIPPTGPSPKVGHILELFLRQGTHPHTQGEIVSIKSSELRKPGTPHPTELNITYQGQAERDFYLKTIHTP